MRLLCCGSLLPVFVLKSVIVAFHLVYVRIIFNLVYVSDWPSFGKEQLTWLTISVLFVLYLFVILVISCFGFEYGFGVLNAQAHGHCLNSLLTFMAIMYLLIPVLYFLRVSSLSGKLV